MPIPPPPPPPPSWTKPPKPTPAPQPTTMSAQPSGFDKGLGTVNRALGAANEIGKINPFSPLTSSVQLGLDAGMSALGKTKLGVAANTALGQFTSWLGANTLAPMGAELRDEVENPKNAFGIPTGHEHLKNVMNALGMAYSGQASFGDVVNAFQPLSDHELDDAIANGPPAEQNLAQFFKDNPNSKEVAVGLMYWFNPANALLHLPFKGAGLLAKGAGKIPIVARAADKVSASPVGTAFHGFKDFFDRFDKARRTYGEPGVQLERRWIQRHNNNEYQATVALRLWAQGTDRAQRIEIRRLVENLPPDKSVPQPHGATLAERADIVRNIRDPLDDAQIAAGYLDKKKKNSAYFPRMATLDYKDPTHPDIPSGKGHSGYASRVGSAEKRRAYANYDVTPKDLFKDDYDPANSFHQWYLERNKNLINKDMLEQAGKVLNIKTGEPMAQAITYSYEGKSGPMEFDPLHPGLGSRAAMKKAAARGGARLGKEKAANVKANEMSNEGTLTDPQDLLRKRAGSVSGKKATAKVLKEEAAAAEALRAKAAGAHKETYKRAAQTVAGTGKRPPEAPPPAPSGPPPPEPPPVQPKGVDEGVEALRQKAGRKGKASQGQAGQAKVDGDVPPGGGLNWHPIDPDHIDAARRDPITRRKLLDSIQNKLNYAIKIGDTARANSLLPIWHELMALEKGTGTFGAGSFAPKAEETTPKVEAAAPVSKAPIKPPPAEALADKAAAKTGRKLSTDMNIDELKERVAFHSSADPKAKASTLAYYRKLLAEKEAGGTGVETAEAPPPVDPETKLREAPPPKAAAPAAPPKGKGGRRRGRFAKKQPATEALADKAAAKTGRVQSKYMNADQMRERIKFHSGPEGKPAALKYYQELYAEKFWPGLPPGKSEFTGTPHIDAAEAPPVADPEAGIAAGPVVAETKPTRTAAPAPSVDEGKVRQAVLRADFDANKKTERFRPGYLLNPAITRDTPLQETTRTQRMPTPDDMATHERKIEESAPPGYVDHITAQLKAGKKLPDGSIEAVIHADGKIDILSGEVEALAAKRAGLTTVPVDIRRMPGAEDHYGKEFTSEVSSDIARNKGIRSGQNVTEPQSPRSKDRYQAPADTRSLADRKAAKAAQEAEMASLLETPSTDESSVTGRAGRELPVGLAPQEDKWRAQEQYGGPPKDAPSIVAHVENKRAAAAEHPHNVPGTTAMPQPPVDFDPKIHGWDPTGDNADSLWNMYRASHMAREKLAAEADPAKRKIWKGIIVDADSGYRRLLDEQNMKAIRDKRGQRGFAQIPPDKAGRVKYVSEPSGRLSNEARRVQMKKSKAAVRAVQTYLSQSLDNEEVAALRRLAGEFSPAFRKAIEQGSVKRSVPAGYNVATAGLGGSPLMNIREAVATAVKPELYHFMRDDLGAPPDHALPITSWMSNINGLAKIGIVSNPVVHGLWNLGTHFLAAGGSPWFFMSDLWRKPDPHWEEQATADGAVYHYNDRGFGLSDLGEGERLATPISKVKGLSPGDTAMRRVDKAASSFRQLNQDIVFNGMERNYSVALYKHFVKDLGMDGKEAGIKVRQTFGDYANVTKSEHATFEKLLFFYPWMKTVIPFWLGKGIEKPGFVTGPVAFARTRNKDMGVPGTSNPFTFALNKDDQGNVNYWTPPIPQRVTDMMTSVNPLDPASYKKSTEYLEGHANPFAATALNLIDTAASQSAEPQYNTLYDKDTDPMTELGQMGAGIGNQFFAPGRAIGNTIRNLGKGDLLSTAAGWAGGFQTRYPAKRERYAEYKLRHQFDKKLYDETDPKKRLQLRHQFHDKLDAIKERFGP